MSPVPGRREASRRGQAPQFAQLNLFSSPLGEFAKEALLLCLRREPPGVCDLALLESICRDLQGHCDRNAVPDSAEEGGSDIECLSQSVDLVNLAIDHYDEWRLRRRERPPEPSPLTRAELTALFEVRGVLRSLIIRIQNPRF